MKYWDLQKKKLVIIMMNKYKIQPKKNKLAKKMFLKKYKNNLIISGKLNIKKIVYIIHFQ